MSCGRSGGLPHEPMNGTVGPGRSLLQSATSGRFLRALSTSYDHPLVMVQAMARPRIYEEERVATAVRLPVSIREELRHLAQARDVSVNYLITRAVEELLTASPSAAEGACLFSRPKTIGQSA